MKNKPFNVSSLLVMFSFLSVAQAQVSVPPQSTTTLLKPTVPALNSINLKPQILVEKETYQVIAQESNVKVNQQTPLKVIVVTKGEHKLNTEYPHRISAPKTADIDTGTEKYTGQLKDKQLEYEVPVIFKKMGPQSLEATAHFSVCNENACYMHKEKIVLKSNVE
jgi:hypothetical protein